MLTSTTPTGTVFLTDFDRGVFETLGGEVRVVTDDDGEQKPSYYLDVLGVGVDIPMIFSAPEPRREKQLAPSLTIKRDEPAFAGNRWHSVGLDYKADAGDPVMVNGVPGFNAKEEKPFALPHDITYTIELVTRLRNQSVRLWKHVLKKFPPRGSRGLDVRDSRNEFRSYEVFNEGSSDISELVDAAERMAGFAVTIRVEGELDLADPFFLPTATENPQVNMTMQ